MRIFADWFNRVWKTLPNGINDRTGDRAEHAARIRGSLDLSEALHDGRDSLFGGFGLADVTAFPFLKYASLGLSRGGHRPVPRRWIAHVDALPRG